MAKIKVNNINLSYIVEKGNGNFNALILHGWGANKELMQQFFSKYLTSSCKQIIFLDLAGFGCSDEPKNAFNSLDYLTLVLDFIKAINIDIDILLGHSYGAKISALMASNKDYKGLILCASAGLKSKKSLKIKLKIILAKSLKILGIKNMRKFLASKDGASLSPIMYETFKNVVDEDFMDEFKKINTKTLLLWGKDDKATPISLGETMHKIIKNSTLKIYDGDHFFFMKNNLKEDFDNFLKNLI